MSGTFPEAARPAGSREACSRSAPSFVGGFELVAERVGLEAQLDRGGVVLTGEGCLDATSFEGKVVGEVLARSRERRLPHAVIAGRVRSTPPDLRAFDLVAAFGEEQALGETVACAELAAAAILDELGR